jgi:cysteine desulfurase/selenocysteine lyase
MDNIIDLREKFPILKKQMHGKQLVYLDNASTTQKPMAVILAEKEFYENTNANIHRSVYELAEKATESYVAAHSSVANFIGADMEEIIFTRNTTEAINLVAFSLEKKIARGKKILVSIMEHHSNFLPWQRMAESIGATLDFVGITSDGYLDMDDFRQKLTKDTALVAVTHISNVLGAVNPVEEVCSLAHEVGALVLIDAAQSAARIKLDVKKIDADFLVFSGHKIYGPLGIGVLYGKRKLLEEMPPFLLGGDMVKEVSKNGATWNELPWKFEAGTQNIAGAVGLGTAIDFLNNIGLDKIWEHEQELVNYIIPKLLAVNGLRIIGPKTSGGQNIERAGVLSFVVEGVHSHDLVSLLDLEGIAARGGHHCAQPLMTELGIKECTRVSFGVTTTIEEMDLFISALIKAVNILRKP